MLFYPAALPLSTSTLTRVARLIRTHRKTLGSRWRTLDPGEQALLTLAHLRKGETLRSLAASFGISPATAWRRTRETIALLAALAPGLRDALRHVKRSGAAFVILDGTLVHIDRNRIDRPYYSGKHQRHGMNLQAIADAHGNLLWISGAIRGSIHDTKAARIWQIPRLLAEHGLFALGDKGYDGLDHDLVVTPIKGKDKPEWQKEVNRLHARLRGPGERVFAQLKTWAIVDQVRCAPERVTQIAKAIQVLNDYEHQSR
ncbi:transposase family protein [Glycomyces sp. A-F 0318]|uniref:transposase family protein n=1 Tax=Glycomyces amatae TaxID=2881355 RepID=UPI001E611BA6|nr:transposase family protein [Glycomyces amatae]MCD0447577.1 transposase family protein [Glycomyces amatae]